MRDFVLVVTWDNDEGMRDNLGGQSCEMILQYAICNDEEDKERNSDATMGHVDTSQEYNSRPARTMVRKHEDTISVNVEERFQG